MDSVILPKALKQWETYRDLRLRYILSETKAVHFHTLSKKQLFPKWVVNYCPFPQQEVSQKEAEHIVFIRRKLCVNLLVQITAKLHSRALTFKKKSSSSRKALLAIYSKQKSSDGKLYNQQEALDAVEAVVKEEWSQLREKLRKEVDTLKSDSEKNLWTDLQVCSLQRVHDLKARLGPPRAASSPDLRRHVASCDNLPHTRKGRFSLFSSRKLLPKSLSKSKPDIMHQDANATYVLECPREGRDSINALVGDGAPQKKKSSRSRFSGFLTQIFGQPLKKLHYGHK